MVYNSMGFAISLRVLLCSVNPHKLCISSFFYLEFDGPLKLKKGKGSISVCVEGRSINPLELEKRCDALESEVNKQNEIISGKEAEKQKAQSTNQSNLQKKKELEGTRATLESEKDKVNKQILEQQKRNNAKQSKIEQLKKEVAATEGKIKS